MGKGEGAKHVVFYKMFAPSEKAKGQNTLYFTVFSRLRKGRRGQKAFPRLSKGFPKPPKVFQALPKRLSQGFLSAFQRLSKGFPKAFQRLFQGFPNALPKAPLFLPPCGRKSGEFQKMRARPQSSTSPEASKNRTWDAFAKTKFSNLKIEN